MDPADWHVMHPEEGRGGQIDRLASIYDRLDDVGSEIRQAQYPSEIGSVDAIDPGQILHRLRLIAFSL